MKPHYGCPIKATTNLLSGKWKVLILWHLAFAPRRFGELRDLLPNVSDKVLTTQLRELEHDGILNRTSTAAIPPAVTYALSPIGQELIPVLETMCGWATRNLGIQPTLPPLNRAPFSAAAHSSLS